MGSVSPEDQPEWSDESLERLSDEHRDLGDSWGSKDRAASLPPTSDSSNWREPAALGSADNRLPPLALRYLRHLVAHVDPLAALLLSGVIAGFAALAGEWVLALVWLLFVPLAALMGHLRDCVILRGTRCCDCAACHSGVKGCHHSTNCVHLMTGPEAAAYYENLRKRRR